MVSCQKGPTRHAYAWQIGPFWQNTIEVWLASTESHCHILCIKLVSPSSKHGAIKRANAFDLVCDVRDTMKGISTRIAVGTK